MQEERATIRRGASWAHLARGDRPSRAIKNKWNGNIVMGYPQPHAKYDQGYRAGAPCVVDESHKPSEQYEDILDLELAMPLIRSFILDLELVMARAVACSYGLEPKITLIVAQKKHTA
uniref:Glutamine synthetase n=1 Tax=Steinernema glaseri TaxID=37863 RepID=A0A1I7ZYI9_9BILA